MQDAKKEGVRDMYGRVKRTFQTYKELLLLGLLGIPIGLVVGGIDAVFGRVLLAITDSSHAAHSVSGFGRCAYCSSLRISGNKKQ